MAAIEREVGLASAAMLPAEEVTLGSLNRAATLLGVQDTCLVEAAQTHP